MNPATKERTRSAILSRTTAGRAAPRELVRVFEKVAVSLAPSPSSTARASVIYARSKVELTPISTLQRSDPPRINANISANPLRAIILSLVRDIIIRWETQELFISSSGKGRTAETALTFCEQA